VRMANMAIVGSHSSNGVAAIHSALLRKLTVKDLAEMYPERFNNKTNEITPRRWLLLANPGLAETITDAIGDRWVTDLGELKRLHPLADDTAFREKLPRRQEGGQIAVCRLAQDELRRHGRPGDYFRLSSQAYPRVQAVAVECAAHHCSLPSATGEPTPRYHAANLFLRRQSGSGLLAG
jgi:hypothetical protein